MQFTDHFVSRSGIPWDVVYTEIDNVEIPAEIRSLPFMSVGIVCLFEDDGENKIVLVLDGQKNKYEMPGGMIEPSETLEEAAMREVKEESNMEIVKLVPLGFEKLTNKLNGEIIYQFRFGAKVKPYGPFVADPAGDVTAIKLIDPANYKQYFDWGARSDAMISKAKHSVLGALNTEC